MRLVAAPAYMFVIILFPLPESWPVSKEKKQTYGKNFGVLLKKSYSMMVRLDSVPRLLPP